MKKATLIATALVCAYLVAGITPATAGPKKEAPAPSPQGRAQVVWAQQSPHPPFPVERTPVAGYSTNLAAPQPATLATLIPEANRLIRWEGWLDVDAFSVSVLNQMQKQLGSGDKVKDFTGSFTIAEPEIAEAVMNAKSSNPTFVMNPNLASDAGQIFEGTPTLYVWTYRHNYTDTGLYQLYVSVKGKMDIGRAWGTVPDPDPLVLHKDIQSLAYEFGGDSIVSGGSHKVEHTVFADVEIWRGAVARLNAKGELEVVGNEAGVITLDGPVEHAPMSGWERAPSLKSNPNYNPKCATGAAFVEPLERAISIPENAVQKRAGDVQMRVNTITPYRFRR